jgi:hypothetical protein
LINVDVYHNPNNIWLVGLGIISKENWDAKLTTILSVIGDFLLNIFRKFWCHFPIWPGRGIIPWAFDALQTIHDIFGENYCLCPITMRVCFEG